MRVKLDRDRVEEITRDVDMSSPQFLIELFKMIVPRWDDVVEVGSHPTCNEKTNMTLCNNCIKLDHREQERVYRETKKNLGYMVGGYWLNYGFSTHNGDTLEDWEVELDETKIKYRDELLIEETPNETSPSEE